MKYLRNGPSSGSLSPLWPVMRGYGQPPMDYAPSAGPNGGFRPFGSTMLVFEEEPSIYQAPPQPVSPPAEAPRTATVPLLTTGAPAPSETTEAVDVAPTGAEVPVEKAPHPYEEEAPAELGPGTVTNGDAAHPPVPARPNGEYVGGTELGPEVGYGAGEEEKSRWPIYVGVGAGVGLLALLTLAAFGGKRK